MGFASVHLFSYELEQFSDQGRVLSVSLGSIQVGPCLWVPCYGDQRQGLHVGGLDS